MCLNLQIIAPFWGIGSLNGPLHLIAERVPQLRGSVYAIDQTLAIDALRVYDTNNLIFISLATHFGLVNEAHIHTFHIHHYLTMQRVHYHL